MKEEESRRREEENALPQLPSPTMTSFFLITGFSIAFVVVESRKKDEMEKEGKREREKEREKRGEYAKSTRVRWLLFSSVRSCSWDGPDLNSFSAGMNWTESSE